MKIGRKKYFREIKGKLKKKDRTEWLFGYGTQEKSEES